MRKSTGPPSYCLRFRKKKRYIKLAHGPWSVLKRLGEKKKQHRLFLARHAIAVKPIACQAVLDHQRKHVDSGRSRSRSIRSEQLTARASSFPHGLETANRSAPSLMLLHALASTVNEAPRT